MKKMLVGDTGFVGGNLNDQIKFDYSFNATNIKESYGLEPDLLYYAGVPAQKFIADTNPSQDFAVIESAINNIKLINPKKIVLISTIDIYETPRDVTEKDKLIVNQNAYGKDRYYLEEWVRNHFDDYLIVHLPALYGKYLKKNFIYDLIHYIPKLLKDSKYEELVKINPDLSKYYRKGNNNFYECRDLNKEETKELKNIFKKLGFSAINFTDSRGVYQFYNLKNLGKDIDIALKNKIKVLNIATEPIKASELYYYVYGESFNNELSKEVPYYNFKTCYADLFHGKNGYILTKEEILKDIKDFVEAQND